MIGAMADDRFGEDGLLLWGFMIEGHSCGVREAFLLRRQGRREWKNGENTGCAAQIALCSACWRCRLQVKVCVARLPFLSFFYRKPCCRSRQRQHLVLASIQIRKGCLVPGHNLP